MKMRGIDISHWQGTIDFERVKANGFEFAIIKAGGADAGYYKDGKFESYYAGAVAAGLHVGAYYFTGPAFCSAAQGKLEAQKFAGLIAGKTFDMPVYVDIEAVPTSMGKAAITAAAVAFCEEMEARGYFVGVYASDIAGFKERMDLAKLAPYSLWVARYNTAGPQYVKSYGMWQYGGSTNYLRSPKVQGVASAACDQDFCYTDFPTIIRGAGLNGYPRPADEPEREPHKADDGQPDHVKLLIGPVSTGDRAKFEDLAADLQVDCVLAPSESA